MTKRRVPQIAYVAPPTLASSWPFFLWLIVTAVAMVFAKLPILVIASIVFFLIG